MGKSCAVKGCIVTRKDGASLSFHRLPADIEIKKLWIECIGEENLQELNKDSRICSRHFNEDCFDTYDGRKTLKPNKIPTNAFHFSQKLPQTPKRYFPKRKCNLLEVIEGMEHDDEDDQCVADDNVQIDNETCSNCKHYKEKYETALSKIEKYKQKIRKLQMQISRRDKKFNKLDEVLEDAKRNNLLNSHSQAMIDNLPEKCRDVLSLWLEQKRPKEYPPVVREFAISLSFLSPKAYDYIRNYFTVLPDKSTISKWYRYVNGGPGILPEALDALRIFQQNTEESIVVSITFDEMCIRKCTEFDGKRTRGLVDFGIDDVFNKNDDNAISLSFLSPKAYDYIRNYFTVLPDKSTISKWYRYVNGGPGILPEALDALRIFQQNTEESIVVSITFDEMCIRKCTEFDGKRTRGLVDFGIDDVFNKNDDNVATQAIVYMAVAINGRFKIPVAYFFIDSLTGIERSTILQHIVPKVSATGVKIASVVCDGCKANITMARDLGVNFITFETKMNFAEENIFFILDNCHMLKLIRNAFAEMGVFYNNDGKKIEFEYIRRLHALQTEEQLTLGNKLTKQHVNFQNQKMKVKLATQVFSSSVADAIDFCRDQSFPGFENSEATTEFLRIIDRLFDIFNTKNVFGKGFKSPLRPQNLYVWNNFLNRAFQYISKLQAHDGTNILNTPRKTGFLGYLTLIRSTQGIFENYVTNGHVKYLLMYKTCQDHVELFFSAIRSKGGFNNNPSCSQFIASFKRLITHVDLNLSKMTNCLRQDESKILFVSSNTKNTEDTETCDDLYPAFDNAVCHINLSMYVESVVEYIAGFVVRRTVQKLKCTHCYHLLVSVNQQWKLINFKNRGGLISPSQDVVHICKNAERKLRSEGQGEIKPIKGKHRIEILKSQIMQEVALDVFKNDNLSHCQTFCNDESHKFVLMKMVIEFYFKIRIHYINKKYTEKIRGESIRQKFNKLIIFRNQ